MQYGLITLPLAPGRAEPSDKAEMVTQFCFGVHYKVLDGNEKWVLIESAIDQYECWIDRKLHCAISEETFLQIDSGKSEISGDVLGILQSEGNADMHIPMGSVLPLAKNGEFEIEGKDFRYKGKVGLTNKHLVSQASLLLHSPYLWGGKSIMGIDCSGFTQMVYRSCGISIPRDAYQQAELGELVDFVNLGQAGDLVFFDNEDGRITHVGMLLSASEIIHASGSVRIDKIDHHGIYHEELGKYTHKTRIIKRFILE